MCVCNNNIAPAGQDNIKAAFTYLEENSCLKFPKWTPTLQNELKLNHNNYLKFGKHSG